jgi:hypothetical protein
MYKGENMLRLTRSILLMTLAGALLTACAAQTTATPAPLPTQDNNPYAPQPSDGTMLRSEVEIVSATVQAGKSLPADVSLLLSFRLATPCNELRVSISQPDSQDRIQMEIYSLAPKDMPCSLMAIITPLETTISLGSVPQGHYTVWVNGQQVGEFDTQ